ncbi:MAG: hypothetical protein KZQ93_06750 [Candidatus Thiodiazotropha sp. (ex Monitilora ramsayi)]|nr:hypothetical protein [Candidatus Thiodiazotropha sp. (ex Monitilora ramsayi)]
MSLALSACSSVGLKSSDIETIRYGDRLEEVKIFNEGRGLYRIDYIVDSRVYRFETRRIKDTGEHYSFLFEQGKLIAVEHISRGDALSPGIRDCALFPPDFDLEVTDCFRAFNASVISNAVLLPNENFSRINQEALDEYRQDQLSGLGTLVVYSPIVGPLAVAVLPIMVLGALDNTKIEEFDIRLGDRYEDIEEYILSLPPETRILLEKEGSIYIQAGVLEFPAVAFGIENGSVVWIKLHPKGVCGAGAFENVDCGIIRSKK